MNENNDQEETQGRNKRKMKENFLKDRTRKRYRSIMYIFKVLNKDLF